MATRASSDGNASLKTHGNSGKALWPRHPGFGLELGNRATAADAKISCRLVEVNGLRV